MAFRTAQSTDAVALAQLINKAFAVERPIFDRDRIDRDGVLTYVEKGKFLIAEDGGGFLGCVYVEVQSETGYVGLLSVEPDQQGKGLGRKLMQAAEEFFRRMGCKEAELRVVSARAPLPGFYRRLGYAESRTEPLPPGVQPKVPCHFQYMTKKLV